MHFPGNFDHWSLTRSVTAFNVLSISPPLLHFTTKKSGLCRSTCVTLSSHLSVILTDDVSQCWCCRHFSTLDTIRVVVSIFHFWCLDSSEGIVSQSPPFICERICTASLREICLSSDDIVRLVRAWDRLADSHMERSLQTLTCLDTSAWPTMRIE